MQTLTSSAVLSYRLLERTTLTGQMLYGSGLRATADADAKTNSSHSQSSTIYNLSIAQVFPLPWEGQKFLLGFDIINLLDQNYFINQSSGSIGLGVAHAGMPRSFFFVDTGFSERPETVPCQIFPGPEILLWDQVNGPCAIRVRYNEFVKAPRCNHGPNDQTGG